MARRVSCLSIYRLEKGVPTPSMVNSEPFDHDLTIECVKQQAVSCIYCGVGDSKAS